MVTAVRKGRMRGFHCAFVVRDDKNACSRPWPQTLLVKGRTFASSSGAFDFVDEGRRRASGRYGKIPQTSASGPWAFHARKAAAHRRRCLALGHRLDTRFEFVVGHRQTISAATAAKQLVENKEVLITLSKASGSARVTAFDLRATLSRGLTIPG